MNQHIVDLGQCQNYHVIIAFGPRMEPALISSGDIPFVSISTEIKANSLTNEADLIRKEYGRIPYGSPLYWWETEINSATNCVYIGQTIKMKLQKRFDSHTKALRLLCKYVNDNETNVYVRLCHRFDIEYSRNEMKNLYALEHLPLDQAQKVVNDVEAYLIYKYKPEFNIKYKNRKKNVWKEFTVEERLMK